MLQILNAFNGRHDQITLKTIRNNVVVAREYRHSHGSFTIIDTQICYLMWFNAFVGLFFSHMFVRLRPKLKYFQSIRND